MPHPLLATARVELNYSVDGLPHKLHAFCRTALTTTSDPTGFDFLDRTGAVENGAELCIDALWDALSHNYAHTGTTFDAAIIQHLISGSWVPVGTHATAIVPLLGSSNQEATQMSIAVRTTAFSRFRIQLMEQFQVPGQHYVAIPTGGPVSNLLNALAPGTAGSGAPGNWITSRDLKYIITGAWFIAATTDLNDKLRRRRGIA